MLRSCLQRYKLTRCAPKQSIAVDIMAELQPKNSTATAATFVFKGSMDKYACLDIQKRESPAADRNKQPILDVMLEYLPRNPSPAPTDGMDAAECNTPGGCRPLLLEIASGSGQHCAHLAAALPDYDVQPSDVTSELFGSITAYAADLPNVRLPPVLLDASAADQWPMAVTSGGGDGVNKSGSNGRGFADVILCINMCHISPVSAAQGLLRGAGTALRDGSGLLFVYGPFTRDGGCHTSESNAAFDASLRSRNQEWGYRDINDMTAWAAEAGLDRMAVRDMPANNFMLLFRKRA